jgi:hypothetical protein
MNCQWAEALTRYDCRPVTTREGNACLEIGTPFSLPDGSAINLYLIEEGTHVRVSDNADTVFQLGGMGIDVWQWQRMGALRDIAAMHRLTLTDRGEIFTLAQRDRVAAGLAVSVTGLIAVSLWAAERLNQPAPEADLAAEIQPYIIARNPAAPFEVAPKVRGASRAVHTFDFKHGLDLIDVISAHPNATGAAMRKAGDVQNGPFADDASPLILVDDRRDPERAQNEIGILASITRAMPVSALIETVH